MTDFYPYAKAVANQLNSLATVRGMYFSSGDLWFDRGFEVVTFLVQHPNASIFEVRNLPMPFFFEKKS